MEKIHIYQIPSQREMSNISLVVEGKYSGFPGGAVVEGLPANAGDMGLSPGLGGSHMSRSS